MLQVEKFNVRIVNTGDKYGLNDCLVNRKEQMIEFYDCRYGRHATKGCTLYQRHGPRPSANCFA